MNDVTYSYPVKVYFGTDAAQKAISRNLGNTGKLSCWLTAAAL